MSHFLHVPADFERKARSLRGIPEGEDCLVRAVATNNEVCCAKNEYNAPLFARRIWLKYDRILTNEPVAMERSEP